MDCNLPGSSVRGILRQEYWSRLPFPSSWDLPDPEIKLGSPALQAVSLPTELRGKPFSKIYQVMYLSSGCSCMTIIVQYYFEEKKNSL